MLTLAENCLSRGQQWVCVADQTERSAHLRHFRKTWIRNEDPWGSIGFLCVPRAPVPAGSEQVGRWCYTHLTDFLTAFLAVVREPLLHYKTPERAHMQTCIQFTWIHTITTLPDWLTHPIESWTASHQHRNKSCALKHSLNHRSSSY